MIKICIIFLVSLSSAWAYVPTVESLLRNGANPEVTTNALTVSLSVKKIQVGSEESSLLKSEKGEDFYRLYFTKNGDGLKIAQARYSSAKFDEASLVHKIYYPNFTAFTMKPTVEQMEKGLFFGLLHSLTFNNGSHLVNYLKALGVPVRLNNELINKDKIEHLAAYKQYLLANQKSRNAVGVNPLRPEDSAAREKIDQVMNESMYVDTKQVSISREEGEMSWLIKAAPFEAVVSYGRREVQKMKFKSTAGEFEVICKDYWLANGTHNLPRTLLIKTFSGETYQVEVSYLRQYNEKDDDLVKRLNKMDQLLKGKTSQDPRPEFLL